MHHLDPQYALIVFNAAQREREREAAQHRLTRRQDHDRPRPPASRRAHPPFRQVVGVLVSSVLRLR